MMEEPTGGQVAPTMAFMNKSPMKGGLTWAQCELVKIDSDEASASYSGGGQGDVPTVRGGKRRYRVTVLSPSVHRTINTHGEPLLPSQALH